MDAQVRRLRACLVCSAVQTFEQFQEEGCPNCEPILALAGNPDRIAECTSNSFSGLLSLMNPDRSWVARWQGLRQRRPGLYAVKCLGRLPVDLAEELAARGITLQQ